MSMSMCSCNVSAQVKERLGPTDRLSEKDVPVAVLAELVLTSDNQSMQGVQRK